MLQIKNVVDFGFYRNTLVFLILIMRLHERNANFARSFKGST